MSALSLSVSPNHIVHEIEPLIQLLYAATISVYPDTRKPGYLDTQKHGYPDTPKPEYTDNQCNLNEEGSACKKDVHISEKYVYIKQRLLRIFIGTMHSSYANDWLISVIGLLSGFWQKRVNSDGKFPTPAPLIYFKEYLIEAMSEVYSDVPRTWATDMKGDGDSEADMKDLDRDGICFDELLLLGRANSHVSFFGDENIASMFKSHVYSHLSIDSTEGLTVVKGTGIFNCTSMSSIYVCIYGLISTCNDYAFQYLCIYTFTYIFLFLGFSGRGLFLRVTIVLRPGPSRLITNFEEVKRLLMESEVVEKVDTYV